MTSYAETPTRHVSGGNGVDYAYRETGRPASVRRLILASSAPHGAAGMHGWAAEVIDAVGQTHAESRRRARRLLRPLIYPESAHGFLFQHHADFAADVDTFSTEPQM